MPEQSGPQSPLLQSTETEDIDWADFWIDVKEGFGLMGDGSAHVTRKPLLSNPRCCRSRINTICANKHYLGSYQRGNILESDNVVIPID